MALSQGRRVGCFEVGELIGAGGMGEVYRARDLRLGRDVALKLLPSLGADDPERLARLRREARVLASLNHPNIATIHGLEEVEGATALVLELIDGPTLDVRIGRQPLSLDEALTIARQIASAVEAAHGHGIIHRDLKPANIKLRPDGTVKVLDFGLAKSLKATEAGDLTAGPTHTHAVDTQSGVLLGTAAYMSPEQAVGRPVDKRADIWAFGCVLYEMLTSRRPFAGRDVPEVLASVLTSEPDLNALPPETPSALRRLLRRCFQKDPKDRLHDMADARLELQDAHAGSDIDTLAITETKSRRRQRLTFYAALVALLALAALLAGGATARFRRSPVDGRSYRASILLPADVNLVREPGGRFALSPDGHRLVFSAAGEGGPSQLWMRALSDGSARPVSGTEGARAPFWSPDSRFVGFFAQGKLKKVDVTGGPPVILTDAEVPAGGSWNEENVILFQAKNRSPLSRISASGGTPSVVTTLDATRGELNHGWPAFLPGGKHFLYFAAGANTAGPFDARAVYVGSLGSRERKLLFEGGSNVSYAQGNLIFLRQGTLMAQPFDVDRQELIGDAVALAEQIQTNPFGWPTAAFSVSEAGLLVYQTGPSQALTQFTWFDRNGNQLGVFGDPANYAHPELSPKGDQVAAAIRDPATGTRDLWLLDVVRGSRTRVTFGDTEERFPTWSPDGTRIAFTSGREGALDIFEKASTGVGAERLLLHDDRNKYPTSWSPDGRFILYYTATRTPQSRADVWVLPLFGDRKPFPFVQTPFDESEGQFSPDGRWVAYQSTESGRPEVYVVPFPAPVRKWPVSTAGGRFPRWTKDEILYVGPDNTVMSATANTKGSTFAIGPTRSLFRLPNVGRNWIPTADAQRFLVNTTAEETTAAPITLLVNWTTGLARPR